MFKNIENNLLIENNEKIYEICKENNEINLGKFFMDILDKRKNEFNNIISKNEEENMKNIKIFVMCNWCTSKDLFILWNKMSKEGEWNGIELSYEFPADYYLIINSATYEPIFERMLKIIEPEKTIIFHMEPNITSNKNLWKEWSNIGKKIPNLFYLGSHENCVNNIEWHLSYNYKDLTTIDFSKYKKDENKYIISAIMSSKYSDLGHKKRINFLKYLEDKGMDIHVYGSNHFNWKNYKGELPPYCKEKGLVPYYYTFNAENCKKKNYLTEKLIDGILCDTLTFYWGCENLEDILPSDCCVILELKDFEKDYYKVKECLDNFEWYNKIKQMRKAKDKILNELQLFPKLEKIVKRKY